VSAVHPLRQRLRTLPERDRLWLLERLEPEERERIAMLLGEDRIERVLGENRVESETAPDAGVAETPHAAPKAGPVEPHLLASAVASEPDFVVAAIVLAGSENARDRLLAALPRKRRRALEARLGDAERKLTPALRAAVLELFEQRLRDVTRARVASSNPAAEDRRQGRLPFTSWLRRATSWLV